MSASPSPKQKSFVRLHVLPALLVLVIPLFAAWFFSYAEDWQDGLAFQAIEKNLATTTLSGERKAVVLAHFRKKPFSQIMALNDAQSLREQELFSDLQLRYATFRWMKWIAWTCLATIGTTLLIVGVSVWYSFRSTAAQYQALRIGWPVLRTSAAIQVLGQGVLAVALSFWVTAITSESYYPKLIGIAAVLALGAAAAFGKAIFAKTDDRFELAGELISETEAPTLWQRVRDMAARLSTAPPDRIVTGIEPTFFVTEHPVIVASEIHHGRTLYLSLPMLKVLAVDEADAILGHELAHFSGEDTLWSLKIAPFRRRFLIYLQLLAHGFSRAVAHFMHAFWKLYELSINRLSREREFRADQIGAGLTSQDAARRALIKVTSYCEFRIATENAIIASEVVDEGLNLALKLEQEYPAFLASFVTNPKSIDERVPHPFDSHPTLRNRLEHLGLEAPATLADEALLQPAGDSWYRAITTAAALEDRLWLEQQEALQSFHEEDVLWRMQGSTEEQEAKLSERFPRVVLAGKKGGQAVLEFDRIELTEWGGPLPFSEIIHAEVNSTWGRQLLVLTHRSGLISKGCTTNINLRDYPGPPVLIDVFGEYYGRHKTAELRSREEKAAT